MLLLPESSLIKSSVLPLHAYNSKNLFKSLHPYIFVSFLLRRLHSHNPNTSLHLPTFSFPYRHG